jgi:MFS family permease
MREAALQAEENRMAAIATAAKRSGGEFSRGWGILLASVIGIGCGLAAIPFYTFGIFAPHLAHEFGWSLGQIMAGLMVTTLVVIFTAPLGGLVSERIGTRRMAIGSMILFGLALLSLATLRGSLMQFYVTWAVAAIVGTGTLPITFTKTVNNWFDQHRGLALGIAMTGTGFFGIICKPLMAWVIGDYGWRAGYLVLGALPLLFALPIASLAFREPRAETDDEARTAQRQLTGYSRSEALKQWRFWLLVAILLPLSFALAGTPPNLESILTDKGLAPATIVSLTPLIGLASIIGRLVGGSLLDRFWAPAVAFLILSTPLVSYMILSAAHLGPGMAAVAIFLIGFALGIEYDVIAYLTSRYFGLKSYAAVYSFLYVCFSTGAGFAPLVFGLIRDRAHNFGPALSACSIVLPISAAGFLLLGRYPRFDDR